MLEKGEADAAISVEKVSETVVDIKLIKLWQIII